jgi:hypothetical protein
LKCKHAIGAVCESFLVTNDLNALVLLRQPIETGSIPDGEAASRVDVGSFVDFEPDVSNGLSVLSRG